MRCKYGRIIVYLLAMVMVLSQLTVWDFGVINSQAATTTNMANVILFVDFQDTDHSQHTANGVGECFLDNPQSTFDMFTGSETVNTGLAEYINTISHGQLQISNVFPQYDENTGEISTFTMSKNVSEYAGTNSSEMISEALVQLEASGLLDDSVDVDLNDDGIIDNVILVAAYTDTDSEGNDIITSHKSEYGGYETVNGLRAGSYNVVTESGGYLGLQKSGVFIHEFMHSLGYPDLYRVGNAEGSTAMPVGNWDIMGKVSYRLQYPLAYLRSHYTNWFTIPTISSDVTGHTIYSASAATATTKDNQALILKTDYSDTEFFVVEYRYTSGTYMSTAYDNYVYGSGLIVYRVNTKQEKNIAGETDLIYVFRPGDTYDSSGNEAGLGELSTSFLSAESGRTSYGSSDYEDGLSEGAITYSDGTNSGIVISNVGSATGDTISFDVSFGDGGQALGGFWNTETTKSITGLSVIDSCMDESGNIYAVTNSVTSTATGSNNAFSVYKYNKTAGWSQLGSSVSVNGGYHKIVRSGDELYVACTDYGNTRINLYKYNNGWERVFRSTHQGDEFDIATDAGKVYMVYNSPYSYGSASYVYCESISNGTETSYGAVATGSYLCNPAVSIYNGEPVVVARDVLGENVIQARRYSSGTSKWENVGDQLVADAFYVQAYDHTLYLMKNGDGEGNYEESYVYSLDLSASNPTWTQLGTNSFIDNSAVPMSMFFYDGAIYITYQNGDVDTQDVYVKTLVNNKWKAVGTKVTRDGILGMSGDVYNQTIYLVYGNSASGITIKTHAYEDEADSVGGNTGGSSGDAGNAGGTGSTGGDSSSSGGTNNSGNSGNGTGDSGDNSGTGDTSQEVFVAPDIKVSYRTHIQSYGWEAEKDNVSKWKSNGAMSGTSGKAKRLEGINIVVNPSTSCSELDLGIQYTTHCQSYGWLPWSADGEMNGTEGEAKRLEAIMIQLTGEHKEEYDVYYRVHAQTYGWLGWAKNGEPAGTAGYAKRLEGIQIVVVKKDASFNKQMGNITSARGEAFVAKAGSSPVVNSSATSNTNPVVPGEASVNVAYRTHVQSYGWQGWKYNGQMSGTSGQAKRLEGINIELRNQMYEGDIIYTTHVQSYGWQGSKTDQSKWMKNGQMSGTSGQAKRLEAICINLTGEMANHYDIYYRVHAQSYGWLGWTKNGAPAGTAGYAKRLEGIQIVLVSKNSGAPTNVEGVASVDTRAYIEK